MISPFTENAAQEFMRKSGLTVMPDLMRSVLREAAEIEQTIGLIRPVTINLCGLVLGRFSNGLPRRFRGGIIRGFLRESLSLPEARDVAGKLIPQLITDSVVKRPRTIADLTSATGFSSSAVRACLRRLGESDRAIVRPLDRQQETWEISHDFLVPLLDSIVARRTVSLWRRFRPWLPWGAAAIMTATAISIPLLSRVDPISELTLQGWSVSRDKGMLRLSFPQGAEYHQHLLASSEMLLHRVSSPLELDLSGTVWDRNLIDLSPLHGLQVLKELWVTDNNVEDLSPLRGLENLTYLNVSHTNVKDLSPLRNLRSLAQVDLSHTDVKDVSPLRGLKNLKELELSGSDVRDVSALSELKNLSIEEDPVRIGKPPIKR